jgi:hypothetical protein
MLSYEIIQSRKMPDFGRLFVSRKIVQLALVFDHTIGLTNGCRVGHVASYSEGLRLIRFLGMSVSLEPLIPSQTKAFRPQDLDTFVFNAGDGMLSPCLFMKQHGLPKV